MMVEQLEMSRVGSGLAISIVNGNGVAIGIEAAQARSMIVRTVNGPI